MSPRRAPLPRGVNANEGQVPLVPQVPQGLQANQVTNDEFKVTISMLAQVVISPNIFF